MKTGIAFIPGTFPTGIVRNAIVEGLPQSGMEWTRNRVNEMYTLYRDGLKAGYSPAKKGEFSIMEYMIENSTYAENDIRIFLYYLVTLSESRAIERKWLNPGLEQRSSNPVIRAMTPGEGALSTVDKAVGAVKWGSIAIVMLAGIYYLWPILKRVRKL